MKKYEILKTIVGSQAHGLAEDGSDTDYRGVYITPTSEILKLGSKIKGSHWLEGESEDNTAYEIGHFLHLAVHCNPSILEVFVAPEVPLLIGNYFELPKIKPEYQNRISLEEANGSTENSIYGTYSWVGDELRELFPHLWTPQKVYDAFIGYGLNQRKKMLDNHLDRWSKYGTAYLRTLKNLIDLLNTGTFSLEIPEGDFKSYIRLVRAGKCTTGEIVDVSNDLTEEAKVALEDHLNNRANFKQFQDIEKVNEFLLKVRREFWE